MDDLETILDAIRAMRAELKKLAPTEVTLTDDDLVDIFNSVVVSDGYSALDSSTILKGLRAISNARLCVL